MVKGVYENKTLVYSDFYKVDTFRLSYHYHLTNIPVWEVGNSLNFSKLFQHPNHRQSIKFTALQKRISHFLFSNKQH